MCQALNSGGGLTGSCYLVFHLRGDHEEECGSLRVWVMIQAHPAGGCQSPGGHLGCGPAGVLGCRALLPAALLVGRPLFLALAAWLWRPRLPELCEALGEESPKSSVITQITAPKWPLIAARRPFSAVRLALGDGAVATLCGFSPFLLFK